MNTTQEDQPVRVIECPDCIWTLEVYGPDEEAVYEDHREQHRLGLR